MSVHFRKDPAAEFHSSAQRAFYAANVRKSLFTRDRQYNNEEKG